MLSRTGPKWAARRAPLVVIALLAVWPAAAAPPLLDPNATEFPDSSLVDFGPTSRADLMQRGFLRLDSAGRFAWADGKRARFWGINVANESVFQPAARIDTVVERLRRAGFNLVRLHHVDGDGRGMYRPQGKEPGWEVERLRALDYWVYRLGLAGISVYLDLLDFRSFGSEEGVRQGERLGRGAKPYAVFDQRLIERQQVYAKALLRDHINEFTGLPYADDPTVALIELYDENGLFIRRRDWPRLVEPYGLELTARWNQYLRQRYGSTAGLRAAWSRSGVDDALGPEVSLEAGTVPLEPLVLSDDRPLWRADERLARARRSDAARFAYQIQRDYFRTMREFLRQKVGVRVPLTAVGDFRVLPDLLATAEELDFLGTNFYWDHPAFRAATPWKPPFFFHYRSPLECQDTSGFAPAIAAARLSGKPLVVREWSHCFPNPHRSAGMVEAAAYAALQDLDAMILFTYGAQDSQRRIGMFDVHQDPARWGLAGILGELFRSRAVAPARNRIDIGYSDVDTFLFKDYDGPLQQLAWVSRVGARCFGEDLLAVADLTVASGRSATGRYSGGPLLLSRHDPAADTQGGLALEVPEHLGYPVPLRQGASGTYRFDLPLLGGPGSALRGAGGRFALADLARLGLRPVGVGKTDALGFVDEQRKVYAFAALTPSERLMATLDVLRLLGTDLTGVTPPQQSASDTAQVRRDSELGQVIIDTPHALAIAGDLRPGRHSFGPLRLETATANGTAVVLSLDGRPLATCERFVAKFLANAQNSHMDLGGPVPGRRLWELGAEGSGPIRTGGRRVRQGWRLYRGGELWLAADLADGVAEVVHDAQGWRWFCDTPGVSFTVPAVKEGRLVRDTGALSAPEEGPTFRYPSLAVMMVGR